MIKASKFRIASNLASRRLSSTQIGPEIREPYRSILKLQNFFTIPSIPLKSVQVLLLSEMNLGQLGLKNSDFQFKAFIKIQIIQTSTLCAGTRRANF
jgi:hypothetical protein